MNILSRRDLAEKKGIPWSREHIHRKVKAGEFPAPFKLTSRGLNYWDEAEIDQWLGQRANKRSEARQATHPERGAP
jgi:predicted DNA-binding transcriptional regulator AlpA